MTYSVVPTNGDSAPATIEVNLDLKGVYEGFDYTRDADGEPFNGSGGTTEIGLDGTWSVWDSDGRGEVRVYDGTLPYGTLPETGGYVSAYQNYTHIATRSISATALRGMLDDGGELWFSFVAGFDGVNMTNQRFFFTIGTDGAYHVSNLADLVNNGNGFGVSLVGQNSGTRVNPLASYWSGGGRTTAASPNPGQIILANRTEALVVGQLLWGNGGPDTLNIYLPDTNLVLGAVRSTIQADLDQSAFDTLSFKFGAGPDIDEIRFGATYDDVIAPSGTGGSAFDTWATSGTVTGVTFGGDANGDGVQDGMAFLLGAASPDDDASGLLPSAEEAGGLQMSFTMLDPAASAPAVLGLSHTGDLGITDPWSAPVAVPATTSTVGGIDFVVSGSGTLSVVATIPASGNALGGKLFGRLEGEE